MQRSIECQYRKDVCESDKGEIATCALISQTVGTPIAVNHSVCERCLIENPGTPAPGQEDIRSMLCKRSLLSLVGSPKSGVKLHRWCRKSREQLIDMCREWGWSDGEIAASMIRGKQIADEVVRRGGPPEHAVTLQEIGQAARKRKLFG